VVSADGLNEGPAGVVMVVPVTSARRGLPSHIEIDDRDSGLDQMSYAKCEDLKSISDRRLVHRLGVVETGVVVEIERVLRYLLDL
jgi:mRNA interferase MazF